MSNKRLVQRTLDTFISKKREYHNTSSNGSDSDSEHNKRPKHLMQNNGNQETPKKPTAAAAAAASYSSSNRPPSFLSLESVIKDPNCQVYKDEQCVCIRDKYAKSKLHYLLVPFHEDAAHRPFSQLNELTKSDLKLLEHLKTVAKQLIETKFAIKTPESYKIGFHSIQSMYPLHMHIITNDFVSDSLKTKKHWNSFNTNYFLNLDDLIDHLRHNENLDEVLLDKNHSEKLLKNDLKCHKCSKVPSNMPKLKEHLIWHLKQEPQK